MTATARVARAPNAGAKGTGAKHAAPAAHTRDAAPDSAEARALDALSSGGQAAPDGLRARLERAYGTPLGGTRFHTDAAAASLASAERARALTVGSHVAFGAGEYRPGTVGGDALIAHEMAHVVQQRPTSTVSSIAAPSPTRALEADANRAAGAALLGLPNAAPRATTGLQLQRCSDAPDVDWSTINSEEFKGHVEAIQRLATAQKTILNAPGWEEDRPAQIASLQAIIRDHVQAIQRLGVNEDESGVLLAALSDDPEKMRRLTAGIVSSAHTAEGEKTTIKRGDPRTFKLNLNYRPILQKRVPIDVRVSWWFVADWAPLPLPDQGQMVTPEQSVMLNSRFWDVFETHRMQVMVRKNPYGPWSFKIMAKVYMGSGDDADTEASVGPITVQEDLPDKPELFAEQFIMLPDPVPAAVPNAATPNTATPATATPNTATPNTATPNTATPDATTPNATTPTTPPAPPTMRTYAMAGAPLLIQPNWFPPAEDAFYYIVHWTHVANVAGKESTVIDDDTRNWQYYLKASLPGVHTVTMTAYPPDADGGKGPRPMLTASRQFTVLTTEELARRTLKSVESQRAGVAYGTSMAELDKQIGDLDIQMKAGSAAYDYLKDRKEQLEKMRSKLRDTIGDPAKIASFPAALTDFTAGVVYGTNLPATFAHPDFGAAYPLSMYLRVQATTSGWSAKLADGTTQDVTAFSGDGSDVEGAIKDAIVSWKKKNDLPMDGTVAYHLKESGIELQDTFSTTTGKKTFWKWFDRIMFIPTIIAALVLLLVPEPTMITKVTALAILGIGIARSVQRILHNVELERPLLGQENILEAIGIVATALGLGGGAAMGRAAATTAQGVRLAGSAMTTFRIGRAAVVTSTLLDGGTLVYMTSEAISQIQANAGDPNLTPSQRQSKIAQSMFALTGQGLLLIATNLDMLKSLRAVGTGKPTILDAIHATTQDIRIDGTMRTRMEAELRDVHAREHPGEKLPDYAAMTDREFLLHYADRSRAGGPVADPAATGGAHAASDSVARLPAGTVTEAEYQGALDRALETLGPRADGQQPKVKVLGNEDYNLRTNSKQGDAHTVIESTGEIVVYVRDGAMPTRMGEEAIHVRQASDPKLKPHFERIGRAGHQSFPAKERLEIAKSRVEIEIDAQRQIIASASAGTGPIDDAVWLEVERAYQSLEGLRAQYAELRAMERLPKIPEDSPLIEGEPLLFGKRGTKKYSTDWRSASADEFIAEYKKRYPETSLSDAELRTRATLNGRRLNPATGRMKFPDPSTTITPGFEAQYKNATPDTIATGRRQPGEKAADMTTAQSKERQTLLDERERLIKERDKAVARGDEAEAALIGAKINEQSRQIGELWGEVAVRQRYPTASKREKIYPPEGAASRSGDFDQVWRIEIPIGGGRKRVEYVVVEAKGGSAELGSRMVVVGGKPVRAEQGSLPYYGTILDIMEKAGGKAADAVVELRGAGVNKVTYLEVRAPIEGGVSRAAEVREFDLTVGKSADKPSP